jgi:hypothetical protein
MVVPLTLLLFAAAPPALQLDLRGNSLTNDGAIIITRGLHAT